MAMPKTKVAITLDAGLLGEVDAMVRQRLFASRSAAIEHAVSEKVLRIRGGRLARECARLDAGEERAMAETGLAEDAGQWPPY
jgi:Arc/MetJ-type ribon-helix-helix transcriptional regulator